MRDPWDELPDDPVINEARAEFERGLDSYMEDWEVSLREALGAPPERSREDPMNTTSYPRYYLHIETGRPIRVLSRLRLPEQLGPDGAWQRIGLVEFDERTERATKEQFDEAVAHFTEDGGTKE